MEKPPSPMLVIAADLVAKRAKAVLDAIPIGNLQLALELRNALGAYYAVREQETIQHAIDDNGPATLRADL